LYREANCRHSGDAVKGKASFTPSESLSQAVLVASNCSGVFILDCWCRRYVHGLPPAREYLQIVFALMKSSISDWKHNFADLNWKHKCAVWQIYASQFKANDKCLI
jgi:hypothetical protein